ncbi:MAG: TlpA disulfide reductase family protein [Devosia sp.]|nr:TlpA disulfide reductase family protein [Devosia sp.]
MSNAGLLKANECQPQPLAAQVIDAAATGQLAALNATATGRGYSAMAFTDAAGKPVTLKDFAGKTLLVNFWASWCIPCRAEMPGLDTLAAAQNSDSFMVLPINLDLGSGGLEKARKFLAEGGWENLPLYADPSFEAFKQLQVAAVATGLPSSLLIDRKGCEIGVLQGPAVWDSPEGIRVIEALKSL